MNKYIEEIRNKYYVEKGYFDEIYLTDEESQIINEMKNKERKIYLKENEIHQNNNNNNLSEHYGEYYKIKNWDISDEELIFLVNLDNNLKLNKIKNYVLSLLLIFIIIILFLVFR